MPTLRVPVKGSVLEGAVLRSGQTVDQLTTKRGFKSLPEWIDQSRQPTLRQLEALAQATVTPLGYLLLDTQVDDPLPIPHFRTRDPSASDTADPDLLETVLTLQSRQNWVRDHLIEKGHDPILAIGTASPSEPSTVVAERLHHFLGTQPGWTENSPTWEQTLSAFKDTIDRRGIFLVVNGVVGNNTHRSLEGKPFSGFSLIDEYAPFVFLNGTDAKSAQMFTLAHELAHILFSSSAACAFDELQATDHTVEQACDRAAAEYLVPSTTLMDAWPDEGDLINKTRLISQRFKVSPIVVARLAFDLRLVDHSAYSHFYQDYRTNVWRERSANQEGGNFYYTQNARLGKQFAKHVINAVESGELLYRDAYSLTDMYGSTFDTYAGYISGHGLP